MATDFYCKFFEENYSGHFDMNFASSGSLCPVFKENLTLGDVLLTHWESTKNYYDSTPCCSKVRCIQDIQPISVNDEIFRCKTPKWTYKDFLSKYSRDRYLKNFWMRFNEPKPAVNKKATHQWITKLWHRSPAPPWIDALAIDQASEGPSCDDLYLGNCLSLIPRADNVTLAVYPDGREHEALRFVELQWSVNETNDFLDAKVLSSYDCFINQEILQLENYSISEKATLLCRTGKDLKLINVPSENDVEKTILLDERLRTVRASPYLVGELAFVKDNEQISFSSGGLHDLKRCSFDRPLPQLESRWQDINNSLEWSDHPRCIFVTKAKHLYLHDFRSYNTDSFWSVPSDDDPIRTIQRVKDDSRYYIVCTDHSVFLMDHRQRYRSVFDFKHGLLDTPAYVCVSDRLSTDSSPWSAFQRLVLACSRHFQQVVAAPLVWSPASRCVCLGHAPVAQASLCNAARRIAMSHPLVRCGAQFFTRCDAPLRGAILIALPDAMATSSANKARNTIALLTLTDVGDLAATRFELTDKMPRRPYDDASISCMKRWIESRSAVYVPEKRFYHPVTLPMLPTPSKLPACLKIAKLEVENSNRCETDQIILSLNDELSEMGTSLNTGSRVSNEQNEECNEMDDAISCCCEVDSDIDEEFREMSFGHCSNINEIEQRFTDLFSKAEECDKPFLSLFFGGNQ